METIFMEQAMFFTKIYWKKRKNSKISENMFPWSLSMKFKLSIIKYSI